MLGPRKKLILGVVVLGALIAIGTLLPIQEYTEAFLAWVRDLGVWGPAIFVVVYAVVVVALLPTWWLSIGAGILFGSGPGLAFAFIAAGAGGWVAFLLGRTVMGETARGWIDDHPRLRAVDREIEKRGWIAALLLRLSPLTPWNVLNYVLGVTRLSSRGYLASLPAMLPVLSLYVILGSTMGQLAAPGEREPGPLEWVMLGIGIVSTIVVTVWLVRVATRTEDGTANG
ncbi:MAG: VTT domain-containing protein [Planctomycetota bacterium]|nr:VTT domain-containing protein [Planctomycetota bacterium]